MTDNGDRPDNVLHLTPRRDAADTPPGSATPRRIGSALLVHELRTPLAAVVRTLQRLSLQRLTNDEETAPAATHLIRRARGLAAELQEVIDELLHATTPEGAAALRSHQETLSIRELLRNVSVMVSSYLEPDRLLIDCREDLTLTTHPGRLCELMVNVLAVATRNTGDGLVSVHAAARERLVVLEVHWSGRGTHLEPDDNGDGDGDEGVGLPLARGLARSLGGTLEVTALAQTTSVRIVLPQQRSRDRGDLAGRGPSHTGG